MKLLPLLLCVLPVLHPGSALAACQWSADGTMTFTINPATASGPVFADVEQPSVKCSVGESFTVQAASANGAGPPAACPVNGLLRDGSGRTMAFTVTCPASGVGQGTAAADPAVALGVAGRVDAVDYENAVAGSGYSDLITFQVSY